MRKIYKTFLASALLLMLHVSMAMGANITYSLSRHTLADGDANKTITASATLNAGASLLDNMPQALWRAYCTYKFYSDPAMTTEITEAPSSDATVYVDYVFDPPFRLSEEGGETIWHRLKGYNPAASKQYYMYVVSNVYETDPTRLEIFGNRSIPKAGGMNDPMKKAGHAQWAFYGDAYDFHIKVNEDGAGWGNNVWLNRSGNTTNIRLGAKQSLGWQLLVNLATNSTFPNGGMMAMQAPNSNYFAELSNLSYAFALSQLKSTNHGINAQNQLYGMPGSRQQTNKNELWWYAFYAVPVGGDATNIWYVTYKILKENGTEWYPDVVKQKAPSAKPALPDFDGKRDDCYYDGFYKDEAFTDKYANGEAMEDGKNVVVYIREVLKNVEPYIADRWITLVLPYNLFGFVDKEAVDVLEYYQVDLDDSGTYYTLRFRKVDTFEPHKPYLFRAKNVLEGQYMEMQKDYTKPLEETWAENKKDTYSDDKFPNSKVSMTGTYVGKELTTFDQHPDQLYFYFGYDKRYDSASDGYVGAEAAEGKYPYNFYRVTKNNVTMPKHRCYFDILNVPAGAKLLLMDNFGEMITGIDGVEADDLVRTTGRIYNLNGQQVGNDLEALPRGVYIVNGKKVMK